MSYDAVHHVLDPKLATRLERVRHPGERRAIAEQRQVALPLPVGERPAVGAPPKVVEPEWQVQFVSDRGNRQLTSAVSSNPWYRSGMETYVPVWAADGERVYCNWFGLCFAVDIATGKLLWRTEKFTQMYERFGNIQQYSLDYDSFTIAAAEGVVLAVSVPADQLNNWQPQNRLIAYDAKTGERIYRSRIGGGGSFVASPVAADGRLYLASEEGDVFVVRSGRTYEELAKNEMKEVIVGTPALSDGFIIIRTLGHVYGVSEHAESRVPSPESRVPSPVVLSKR